MIESMIRELIRMQDRLITEYPLDREVWQEWALANEKVIYELEKMLDKDNGK